MAGLPHHRMMRFPAPLRIDTDVTTLFRLFRAGPDIAEAARRHATYKVALVLLLFRGQHDRIGAKPATLALEIRE